MSEIPAPRPLSFHIPRIDTRNLGHRHLDLDYVHQFVETQFTRLRVGQVHHVDLLSRHNRQGYLYYEAFVHFSEWYNNAYSLGLRRAACSPRQKATITLPGRARHYWIVNQNQNAPLVEDFQSILSAIPVARWQQAADEAELAEHQEAVLIERWYKHAPTDDELDAVALIEAAWTRRSVPATPPARGSHVWVCDSCHRPAQDDDPESEAYEGSVCGRCCRDPSWFKGAADRPRRTQAWGC